jgi:dihydroorotate dehydrogenase electron transfer subunit
MKQQIATFIAARPNPPVWEVRFEMERCPSPGQYVLAELGEAVRTVLYPAAITASSFSTIVPPGHPAINLLPGTPIDILGPQGTGFTIDADRVLLIADVNHFPLLMPLLGCAPSVSVILEAASRLQLPSTQVFPPNIELISVTLDGSTGYLGPLESTDPAPMRHTRAFTVLLELISWAEQVCLALSINRYPDIANIIYNARLNPRENFAQAIIQTPMPCGNGICDICRISTQKGEKQVCIDGPVFNLRDLANQVP